MTKDTMGLLSSEPDMSLWWNCVQGLGALDQDSGESGRWVSLSEMNPYMVVLKRKLMAQLGPAKNSGTGPIMAMKLRDQ